MDSKTVTALINGIIAGLTVAPHLVSQIKALVRMLDRLEAGDKITEGEVTEIFADLRARSERIQSA